MNCFRLLRIQRNVKNLCLNYLIQKPTLLINRTISFTSKSLDSKETVNKNDEKNNSSKSTPKKRPVDLLLTKKILDTIFFFILAYGCYHAYKSYKEKKTLTKAFNIEYLTDTKFKNKLFKTNLGPYILPDYLEKLFTTLKSFELRNDDIWIVSFPKSGTTWVQEIVYLIMNNCDFVKAKSATIEERIPFFDFPNPGVNVIKKLASPRIIKTHLPKPLLPDDVEKKCKVFIFIFFFFL
jgi:hypothetical protein